MTVLPSHEPVRSEIERIDMSDLAIPPSRHRIAAVSAGARGVTVDWDDGRQGQFRAVWLRDNCACVVCRHPQARERRFLLIDTPGEIAIAAAGVTPGGNLEVRFAPLADEHAHVSRFDAAWLRGLAEKTGDTGIRRQLWDAGLAVNLPTVTYDAVMTSDDGLARWLGALAEFGIVLLRGAPARPGEILRIAARVQPHPRPTNFGAMYDVVSVPNPNASADTPMALEPHTDLANWRYPPDIQLLFCVANEADGGSSVLVDGCRVAEELRAADPDAFRLLTTVPVEFRFHDADCDIRHRGPTIETDRDGTVVAVRFNNWLRTAFDLPDQLVEPMYRALTRFWSLLREPRFQLRLRLEAGDMLAANNLQILHGRDAFDPTTGRRHLQGCYVDLDMVLSRLRVLARGQA